MDNVQKHNNVMGIIYTAKKYAKIPEKLLKHKTATYVYFSRTYLYTLKHNTI
jgi:hypothetical protein